MSSSMETPSFPEITAIQVWTINPSGVGSDRKFDASEAWNLGDRTKTTIRYGTSSIMIEKLASDRNYKKVAAPFKYDQCVIEPTTLYLPVMTTMPGRSNGWWLLKNSDLRNESIQRWCRAQIPSTDGVRVVNGRAVWRFHGNDLVHCSSIGSLWRNLWAISPPPAHYPHPTSIRSSLLTTGLWPSPERPCKSTYVEVPPRISFGSDSIVHPIPSSHGPFTFLDISPWLLVRFWWSGLFGPSYCYSMKVVFPVLINY